MTDPNLNPFAKGIPKGGGRDILSELLGVQQGNVNELNQAAQAIQNRPKETDLSPLLALSDQWTGGNLSGAYSKPLSDDERLIASAKLKQLASGDQQKLAETVARDVTGADKNAALYEKVLAANDKAANKVDWTQQVYQNKLMQDFGKDLDIYRSARGGIGKIAQSGVSAGRAQTLIDAFKDKKKYPEGMPSAQLAELAGTLASLVTGGSGVVNQEQINNILPKGLALNKANVESYLLSKPVGANMQPFVDLMEGTIQREAKTAATQAKHWRLTNLPKHSGAYNLSDQSKKQFLQMAAANGISPEEVTQAMTQDPTAMAKAFEEMPVYKEPAAKVWPKAQVEAAAKAMGITTEEALKRLQGQGHGVQ